MRNETRERMQAAIRRAMTTVAAADLERDRIKDQPLGPGDLCVWPHTDPTVLIEWLIVREHPDDPTVILTVPVDDCPLVGTVDVQLDDRLVARCGESAWIPQDRFRAEWRVRRVDPGDLAAVRSMLAGLARGKLPGGHGDELDPEYADWMAGIERCRAEIEAAPATLSLR